MEASFNTEVLKSALNALPRAYRSGKVTKVVGLIVEGYLPGAPVRSMCRIRMQSGANVEAEVLGVRGSLALLMPLGETHGIQAGDSIELLHDQSTILVGEELLGRILDGMGNPMDGMPLPKHLKTHPLYAPPINAVRRQKIHQSLELGVRAVDGFLNLGFGQRMAILAGSGVGKSTLLAMFARNSRADVNVIGLIGERGREVREFIENDLGPEGLSRSVIVIATSDAPALIRMRAAFTATSIAEYFRDRGKKVLLMMDSLTRFAMASREIGLALGEPPTNKGYTPSLFSILPKLLERAGTSEGEGSITGLYTILAEGDDVQDPLADAVRAIVDGHVVLSRKLAQEAHFPSIDVLQSISRVMPNIVDKDHLEAASKLRRILALYNEMEDYIHIGVYTPGKNPELDEAVSKIEAINAFLRQGMSEKTSLPETKARMMKLLMEG